MKILLRESVEKLGKRGEIVDVTGGFARNFLLPRGMAVPATAASFRQLEAERARIVRQDAKERVEREAARSRLESVSCTITAAASPEGHLYGSVTASAIAEAIRAEGVAVEDSNVWLEEPIKEVGVYLVEARLAPDLVARTRVWVVAQ